MENGNNHMKNENVSSTLSMYPPNSNSPDSAPLPPYSNPSQYPPTSGIPYPHQYPPPNSAMGYPQPYVPPPGGQPYYPQPGGSNQQQQVVITNQPIGLAPLFVVGEPRFSMTGAIILSCITFWCFGWLFGGIAFILAMSAQSSAAAGDTRGAIRLRNASYGLSIAGIVIAVIVIAVVAGVSSSRYSRSYNCNSYYYGTSYCK